MIILNFSYQLTESQLLQIEALTSQTVEKTWDFPVSFDVNVPFSQQMEALLADFPLSVQELQSLPILVVLPSYNVISALLLAELHGRMGYFPAVVRMRQVGDSVPKVFEAAEIIDLQAVRNAAREMRF